VEPMDIDGVDKAPFTPPEG